jgi:hypothetical protein
MVRLPTQMVELGEDMAIEEFRKVDGRSKIIDITVAGSSDMP